VYYILKMMLLKKSLPRLVLEQYIYFLAISIYLYFSNTVVFFVVLQFLWVMFMPRSWSELTRCWHKSLTTAGQTERGQMGMEMKWVSKF